MSYNRDDRQSANHTSDLGNAERDPVLGWLDQLRTDPNAAAPDEVDPAYAATLRRLVRSAASQPLSSDRKVALWSRIRRDARQVQPDSRQATVVLDTIKSHHQTPQLNQSMNERVKGRTMYPTLPFAPQAERAKTGATAKPNRELRGMTLVAALLIVGLSAVIVARALIPPPIPNTPGAITDPTPDAGDQVLFNPIAYLNTQPYRNIVWSPTGMQYAAIQRENDSQIGIYDRLGNLTNTLSGHTGLILQLAWSPDGTTLASAGDDQTVRLWNIYSYAYGGQSTAVAVLTGHTGRVDSVDWSPDGLTLASAASTDGSIRLWSAAGKALRTISFSPTAADGSTLLYWSPDSQYLAARYSDNNLDIWNADGTISTSLRDGNAQINAFAWSPDGRYYAVATVNRGLVIYTFIKGEKSIQRSLSQSAAAFSIQWSADGRHIAALVNPGALVVWDLTSGREVSVRLTEARITDISFSPDSTEIAYGVGGQQSTQIVVADLNLAARLSFANRRTAEASDYVTVAWSPDGVSLLGKHGNISPQVYVTKEGGFVPGIVIDPAWTVVPPGIQSIATPRAVPGSGVQPPQVPNWTVIPPPDSLNWTVIAPPPGQPNWATVVPPSAPIIIYTDVPTLIPSVTTTPTNTATATPTPTVEATR